MSKGKIAVTKPRRIPARRTSRKQRRSATKQVLQRARTYQQFHRREGKISVTDDQSGPITLHVEVGGKTKGRVLEVHEPDLVSGAVPVKEQIEAFVRRLPPARKRPKRTQS